MSETNAFSALTCGSEPTLWQPEQYCLLDALHGSAASLNPLFECVGSQQTGQRLNGAFHPIL